MKLKLTMHTNSRKKKKEEKKKEKYRKYKGCSSTSLCSVRRHIELSRLARQGRDASVPVQP